MRNKVIYADNAATTGICPEALVEMWPYLLGEYGNPSSAHVKGRKALEAIEMSRCIVAKCIGADSEKEIIFTSGGTEADNQALRSGAALGNTRRKRHIITTAIEHHAVLETVDQLQEEGCAVTKLGVDKRGVVDVEDFINAIKLNTIMASVMMANNEVGVLEPIGTIGKLCREKSILFHTDAVQAAGHVPIDVKELCVDMLSMSAHKFHGPKGVGALYVREGCPVYPIIFGGGQERGLRSGTENVAGIVGMAVALETACEKMAENTMKVTRMRNRLIETVEESVPRCSVTVERGRSLPGIASFCFAGIEGASLVLRLDADGICASAGSACTTGTLEPSHVLLAMGIPDDRINGSLRISLDENNTEQDVDAIAHSIIQNVEALRRMSATWRGK